MANPIADGKCNRRRSDDQGKSGKKGAIGALGIPNKQEQVD
jgi:hypothetical protein